MAFSYHDYTGDNSTTQFSIPFTYQNTSEISVTVDGVAQTGLTFPSSSTVKLTSAPASGTLVQVRRTTSLTTRAVDFASGSVLTEEDLDNSNIQTFHAAQEAVDKANDGITLDTDDKWNAQSKVIKNVADPVANTDAVNKQFLGTNLPNITTVAGIAGDVSAVAGISSNVTTVAADTTDIGTVATNIASVNTVATNISDVVTVANDLNEAISEIETAALDLQEATSEIDVVANNIANVNTVGTNITNVNATGGDIANVNTVATNIANVNTTAGSISNVNTVGGDITNVNTVASNATNINTVAGVSGNVTTVAGIAANVTTVANDGTDIGVVASNIADVNTVAANNANVTAVAGNSTNINSVAGNTTNINTVAGAATNINTVASNLTNVNSFANTYFIGTSAPSSPTTGDLWFDSTPSVLTMKVYNGSGFVNAGSSVNGTAARESYIVGTNSGSYTGSTTVFPATYDAGFVDVYLNGVKLHGADFTATNGTSITLASAATSGDTLDVLSFGTFTLANIAANQLTDVYTTGVADGQILQYSSSNSRFEPVTFQGGAGYFVGENGTTGNTSTGLGDIFRVHEAALDTATTIPSNTNALAAGPLTLNAALTVNGTVTVV